MHRDGNGTGNATTPRSFKAVLRCDIAPAWLVQFGCAAAKLARRSALAYVSRGDRSLPVRRPFVQVLRNARVAEAIAHGRTSSFQFLAAKSCAPCACGCRGPLAAARQ